MVPRVKISLTHPADTGFALTGNLPVSREPFPPARSGERPAPPNPQRSILPLIGKHNNSSQIASYCCVVPRVRIELTTPGSSGPRSTTELPRHVYGYNVLLSRGSIVPRSPKAQEKAPSADFSETLFLYGG